MMVNQSTIKVNGVAYILRQPECKKNTSSGNVSVQSLQFDG